MLLSVTCFFIAAFFFSLKFCCLYFVFTSPSNGDLVILLLAAIAAALLALGCGATVHPCLLRSCASWGIGFFVGSLFTASTSIMMCPGFILVRRFVFSVRSFYVPCDIF